MGVGQSGRIVVELDPALKRRLHDRLRNEGRDFKGWLLERVKEYLAVPRNGAGPQDGAGSQDAAGSRDSAEPRGGERSRDGEASGDSEASRRRERAPSGLSELEERVLDAMSSSGRAQLHLDELERATGLGIGQLQAALLQLELRGCIAQHLGFYRRVGRS